MMTRRVVMLMLAAFLGCCGLTYAAGDGGLDIRASRAGATVTVDRVIKEGKVLVSVSDSAQKPVLGLKAADFTATQAGRKAKIISVQPIAETQDVPRHIVMVLDNSYSMYERNAIKALLSGVDNVLKIVRPIDRVSLVTFDNKLTTTVGGKVLRVQTYQSSDRDQLRAYVREAYSQKGLTPTTVLYEAMVAGLDFIARAPAGEPRMLVVFSDGEDLNSTVKPDAVAAAARAAGSFNAYAIDYLEGQGTNKFLWKFAGDNRGKAWKAKSEANLVQIFQSVASKLEHYYVVSYQFVTTGKLAVAPAAVTIDEVAAATVTRTSDAAALTLTPTIDSAYGVTRWKAVASNGRGNVAELSGEGAPPAAIRLPLPDDLPALAAGGDITVKLEVADNSGQSLALAAGPVKVRSTRTAAGLDVAPAAVKIEEIRTIDSSPMLAQVFFDKGSSEFQARYVRFKAPAETAGFDPQSFGGTMEKYYQVLNIIGKRLVDNPAATITVVGCNDNLGAEKGNKKLSTARAEAVRAYLQSVWGIAPARMQVEARNLPKVPSAGRLPEGQAENRRVEILSADPAILAPIRSTYIAKRIDAPALVLKPAVTAPYGVESWKATALNATGTIAEQSGTGIPAREIKFDLAGKDLPALAAGGDITVKLELKDKKGQQLAVTGAAPVKVTFVETRQRLAEKQGEKVQEKYALILFDFDKDTIGPANQEIVNRIVERVKTLPDAAAAIVGHTDTIGKEQYNVKLSERRAASVNKQVKAAYGAAPADRVTFSGVGPKAPLYDNQTPEGRSFNRTVTITLEYLSKE